MVSPEFEQWALGFSGCDGGNPHGRTWICGIEWGGGHTEDNLRFEDATVPGFVGDRNWQQEDLKQFLKYQYNWKAVKLLCALAGRDLAEYPEFFQSARCFSNDSEYFKLNLYPLGFKDTGPARWQNWLTTRTGFPTKDTYIAWCRANRFPVLRRWVELYSPQLIICTGIDHRADFFDAFTDGLTESKREIAAGKDVFYKWTNSGRTLVAVIYFLGTPHGLKTDSELRITAETLLQIIERG